LVRSRQMRKSRGALCRCRFDKTPRTTLACFAEEFPFQPIDEYRPEHINRSASDVGAQDTVRNLSALVGDPEDHEIWAQREILGLSDL
jgi:hypothetical protein